MKKIIGLSVAIALIIALIGTGTWALFSDTEETLDNTFTAGIIDLEVPVGGGVVTVPVTGLTDLKPCETGYITITLTPTADSNPMHVWKHIKTIIDEDRVDTTITEPEQAWYTDENSGVAKNDIDRYIHFDMTVNDTEVVILESEGWLLSHNGTTASGIFDPEIIAGADNGVACHWIYLGILDPRTTGAYAGSVTTMVIEQSFHMDGSVGNWAQSDILTFDEEFFALQVVGSPTLADLPGDAVELPGYGFFN